MSSSSEQPLAPQPTERAANDGDILFQPLRFRNLTVKNRIFRSSISGRFDHYNGNGSQVRINWVEKFARGGVGAIISAHAPIDPTGRGLPNYAFISSDKHIPFWRRLGETVHEYDCKFFPQLTHVGRQRDIGGIENRNRLALSSTNRPESLHGFPCRSLTREEIKRIVQCYADAARRAREAGLDGVEIHGCNGYIVTQFLSSAINDRKDEYGGPLENRARFLLELIQAIRHEVGRDFHLQIKISAVEHYNAMHTWEKPGNTLEDSIQVCRWIEEAGADAIHVSTGSYFPHPRNPPGDFPLDAAADNCGILLSEGLYTHRNDWIFRSRLLGPLFRRQWRRALGKTIEGISVEDAKAIKQHVSIPILATGGFQTASVIRRVLSERYCDAVTIARPLVANNELVQIFAQGKDRPERPCTYCNRCLVNVLKSPLGCYDITRLRWGLRPNDPADHVGVRAPGFPVNRNRPQAGDSRSCERLRYKAFHGP